MELARGKLKELKEIFKGNGWQHCFQTEIF
jgi:hypothetical protein